MLASALRRRTTQTPAAIAQLKTFPMSIDEVSEKSKLNDAYKGWVRCEVQDKIKCIFSWDSNDYEDSQEAFKRYRSKRCSKRLDRGKDARIR